MFTHLATFGVSERWIKRERRLFTLLRFQVNTLGIHIAPIKLCCQFLFQRKAVVCSCHKGANGGCENFCNVKTRLRNVKSFSNAFVFGAHAEKWSLSNCIVQNLSVCSVFEKYCFHSKAMWTQGKNSHVLLHFLMTECRFCCSIFPILHKFIWQVTRVESL